MDSEQRHLDREKASFYIAVGLLLIPIWVFPEFGTQDGPVHLYNADLILQLLANPDNWFSDWIDLNTRPDPTWAPHLLMAGLLSFLSPELTEKLFQSACVGLIPVSARYALGGLGNGSGRWAWLSLPMAYNYPLHLGFYSFCLGLSVAMLMLGYWLRQNDSWNIRSIIVQACLALAAYFSHVFALLAFGIAMLPVALARLWQAWHKTGPVAAIRGQVIPWALAFAPAVLLATEFLLSRPQEAYPMDLVWRFKALAQFVALQSFRAMEQYPSIAVACVLFAYSLVAVVAAIRSKRVLAAAWIVSMGLLFAVAMLLPESVMLSDDGMNGGAFLVPRIGMVFYLCSLFLIAAQPGWPRFRGAVIYLALALTLVGVGMRWPVYLELERQLGEYDTAEQYVNPGEVVIALNVQRGSFLSIRRNAMYYADPTRHHVNRIATRRGAFSFNNYEANMGYFPLLFAAHANPWIHLGVVEAEPPVLDIPGFENAIGRHLDVILVWMGASQIVDSGPLVKQIEDAGFGRVYVSEPGGRMWVYRRPAEIL